MSSHSPSYPVNLWNEKQTHHQGKETANSPLRLVYYTCVQYMLCMDSLLEWVVWLVADMVVEKQWLMLLVDSTLFMAPLSEF